ERWGREATTGVGLAAHPAASIVAYGDLNSSITRQRFTRPLLRDRMFASCCRGSIVGRDAGFSLIAAAAPRHHHRWIHVRAVCRSVPAADRLGGGRLPAPARG